MSRRPTNKVLADLLEATDAAAELVARGRLAFDQDRMLRLVAEAVIGRIGDAAKKLHDAFGDALPRDIPWTDVVGARVLVAHAHHRIDYEVLRATLTDDVPKLRQAMWAWAQERGLDVEQ